MTEKDTSGPADPPRSGDLSPEHPEVVPPELAGSDDTATATEVSADPHADVGAYAVDALDPPERAEFRAHLMSCAQCRTEVAEFRAATAELALLVATPPPAELRAATSIGIRGVRQLPPPAERDPSPVRHLPPLPEVAPLDDHPSVMPWSLELGARPAPAPAPLPRVPAARPGLDRRLDRRLLALVAALLVVVVGLGGWLVVSTGQRSAEIAAGRADLEQQTRLLSAPDVRLLTSTLNGAAVSYVYSRQQNRALVIGEGVPEPGPGRVYQFWLVDGGSRATSVGLDPEGGTLRVWLAGDLAGADVMAVTAEPGPNGSAQPTQDPISAVTLG